MSHMTQIMKHVSHTTLMAAPQHKLPQLNQPQLKLLQLSKPQPRLPQLSKPLLRSPQLKLPQPRSPQLSKPLQRSQLQRSLQLSIPHLRSPPLSTQHKSHQSQLRDPAHQASVTNQTVQLNPKDPCSLTMIVISTGNVSMV